MPPKTADISAEMSSYDKSKYKQFIYGVLLKRYPFGHYLVKNAPPHSQTKEDCIDYFLKQGMSKNLVSAPEMIKGLSTWVHECGHFFAGLQFGKHKYPIKTGLELTCSGMGAADSKLPQYKPMGFNSVPRSSIKSDKWSAKHPPCASPFDKGCDKYAYIYLGGDPDNGKFESGDQGFDLLMEEVVQYVNSLATSYAFEDKYQAGTKRSARDGILNFLWYLQRYLYLVRTKHAAVHKALLADACWRKLILNVWGRGWLYLEATKSSLKLGMQDKKLEGLVTDPELMEEIQLVRKAHGC